METRAEMSKKLGQAVHKICKGTDSANAFEDFMEDSVEAEEFMDYFKATWYPRMGNSSSTKRLVYACLLYGLVAQTKSSVLPDLFAPTWRGSSLCTEDFRFSYHFTQTELNPTIICLFHDVLIQHVNTFKFGIINELWHS